LLKERTAPELVYVESKFAALMSYGLAADVLEQLLPIGRTVHAATVRNHVHAVAERMEAELGEEKVCFIEGCEREWKQLPQPALLLTVELDGGFVHSSEQRSRTDGWFEVITGKSMTATGAAKCLAFVNTYDQKSKRRLFELLKSQGMAMNQQVTFLSDGGDDVREVPCYLNPEAEQWLDWFHITMRVTVMKNMAKSLKWQQELVEERENEEPDLSATAIKELERVKWFLWHGNVVRALESVEELEELSGLDSDEWLAGDRMLPLGEARELHLVDRAREPPRRRQSSIPLAPNVLAFAVVVLPRVAEVFAMIPLGLPGAERLRDRHHPAR
jgi:hypothetical protein